MSEVQGYTTAEQGKAHALDDDIRSVVASIRAQWSDLQELLIRAESSGVHAILGFRSWTAYIADVFGETGPIRLDKADRTQAIVSMTDELGMSARAIGAVLGVGAATVSKVAQANGAGNKQVIGMNGATYMPSVLRKRKAIPPPVILDDPPDIDAPPDDGPEPEAKPTTGVGGPLMSEAKRLNTVLNAVAGELAVLERNYNFRSRRRYVMAELRPGIVRLYEQVQGMASE